MTGSRAFGARSLRNQLLVLLAACTVSSCAGAPEPKIERPPLRLDHVAIWTRDIEATARFLTEVVGWKRLPLEFGVSAADQTTGGLALALIDANGLWLELVSPTSPGPGSAVLDARGHGAFVELAFEAKDYDATLAMMRRRGIGMVNMDGSPLQQDGGVIKQGIGRGAVLDPSGIRIAYWPKDLSHGTSVEMYEYRDGVETDVFTKRNRMWRNVSPNPDAPRVDRIAIIVEDIERTARFYTDVMGLKRQTPTFTLDGGTNQRSGGMQVRFIDAGGVSLALVQPVGPGPLMDYLKEKGDGFIAELIVEVDDLGAYHDAMKRKGIQMVDTSGAPVDPVEKAHVLAPFGDRIAYFPTSVSEGMVIEVSQRGPRATSLIHARDRNWKQ